MQFNIPELLLQAMLRRCKETIQQILVRELPSVGGNVQATNLIRKIQPVYPPLAKAARISGTVQFTLIIDREGNVANLQLVSGHPLLVEAAREAVAQWTYKPTWLNGSPVEVVTQVDVNFTISE